MYIKDGPLVKLLDGGMGQAMKKKIIRKKKIVEEIKGMLKKERKKKKHAGWKFPTPAITFLMRHS